MEAKFNLSDGIDAAVGRKAIERDYFNLKGRFKVVIHDKDGNHKGTHYIDNMVVTEGQNYLLNAGLDAATQITSWFMGLCGASPTPALGDTLASHAGWTEFTNYTGDRQLINWTPSTARNINNNANALVFTIDTDTQTVGGLFICSVATGTSGVLLAAGPWDTGGDKTGLNNGDTLTCTYELTSADS